METKEFNLTKKLIELETNNKKEIILLEFEKKKELELFKHNLELERQRIRSADIRRSIERKSDKKFMESYAK